MFPDYIDCWQYEAPPGSGNKASTCVLTTCEPDETEEECEARHDAKVARRQASKPPCAPMAPVIMGSPALAPIQPSREGR